MKTFDVEISTKRTIRVTVEPDQVNPGEGYDDVAEDLATDVFYTVGSADCIEDDGLTVESVVEIEGQQ